MSCTELNDSGQNVTRQSSNNCSDLKPQVLTSDRNYSNRIA